MEFPNQDLTQPATQPTIPPNRVLTPRTDEGPAGVQEITPQNDNSEAERTQGVCADQLNELRTSTLASVSLDIRVHGTAGHDFPYECSVEEGGSHEGRNWDGTTYLWKASAVCHKPLYFENEQMERYGHSCGPCWDPIVAGAHFFTRLPVLPYCMGLTPPNECIYALGHYRPGSCARGCSTRCRCTGVRCG